MMYVLILVGWGVSGAPTIAMTDFNSYDTCQAALERVQGSKGYGRGIDGECVPK
jgi:hypothetical protein